MGSNTKVVLWILFYSSYLLTCRSNEEDTDENVFHERVPGKVNKLPFSIYVRHKVNKNMCKGINPLHQVKENL